MYEKETITATTQAQIIPDQTSQTHEITTHTLANTSISQDQNITDQATATSCSKSNTWIVFNTRCAIQPVA